MRNTRGKWLGEEKARWLLMAASALSEKRRSGLASSAIGIQKTGPRTGRPKNTMLLSGNKRKNFYAGRGGPIANCADDHHRSLLFGALRGKGQS